MKNKETLEEAAERLFKEYSNNTSLSEGHYDYMMDKEDFKEASLEIAKWQQEPEQFFNDDRVKILEKAIEYLLKKQERSYSEEYISEKLFNHPAMCRIRESKSDAEARRIILELLKKK